MSRDRDAERPPRPRPQQPPPTLAAPTCGGCTHWRKGGGDLGRCVEAPPDQVLKVVTDPPGPLCVYRVTESTLPACGRFAPK